MVLGTILVSSVVKVLNSWRSMSVVIAYDAWVLGFVLCIKFCLLGQQRNSADQDEFIFWSVQWCLVSMHWLNNVGSTPLWCHENEPKWQESITANYKCLHLYTHGTWYHAMMLNFLLNANSDIQSYYFLSTYS
jgi:hypothetical protein